MSISSAGGNREHYEFEAIERRLSSLVGRTVIAANDVVSAWALLYAAMSGHSLPFVGSLFDRWAREAVQRDGIARLARAYLQNLPHELEQVETLLARADELAHTRDLLVGQPWSIGHLDERMTHPWSPASHRDVAIEREAQFDWLLSSLQLLRRDVLHVAEAFRLSRNVEKVRVLNRSAVLAAELKFTRKARRPRAGPRHNDWPEVLRA